MPETIELNGPLQKKRDKYFALLNIGVLTKDQMAKAQGLARDIVKADIELEKEKSKLQGQVEKDRILYEARRSKSELALADLRRRLPVTADTVDKFVKAHLAADGKLLADKDDYPGALKALKEVSATHAPEQAVEEWEKAKGKAAKLAPDAFATIQRIDEQLAVKDLQLPPDVVQVVRVQRTQHMRALLVPKPTPEQINQTTQALKRLLQDLQADVQQAQQEWQRVEELRAATSRELNMIAPLSGDEVPLLTDREAAPMRLALSSAATSIAAKDFASARQVLAPMRLEIATIRDRVGPLRQQWLQHQPQLAPRAVAARKLATEALSPQVKQDAYALAASLEEVIRLGVGRGMTFADATDRVTAAEGALKKLAEQDTQWLKFQGKGDQLADDSGSGSDDDDELPDSSSEEGDDDSLPAAKKRIEALFKGVRNALHKLHEAVDKATGGKHRYVADVRFTERLDDAREEWDERVQLARDAQTLDEAGMKSKLAQLRSDILAVSKDSAQLVDAIDDGRLERARNEYLEARALAVEACERYIGVDAVNGGQRLLEIEALGDLLGSDPLPPDYRVLTGRLKKLLKKINDAQQLQAQAVAQAQQELKDVLAPLPGQLQQIKELADKAKTGGKQQPLVALLDTLQGSLDGLRAMAGLTQLPLLRSAKSDAEAFAIEVKDSLEAAKGEGGLGGSLSFESARKRIANLKGDIADKDAKLYCVSTQFKLTEEVEALEKGLGTMSMKAMTQTLADLVTRAAQMKIAAADAKQRTKNFEQTIIKALRDQLDDKRYKDAPDYKKSVEGRIKSLIADFQFEDGQDKAIEAAAALDLELKDMLTGDPDERGVPKKLAAQQKAADDAKNKKIIDKKKWEGESEVMGKKLTSLEQINPREIGALQDMLDSAKKAAEKSGEYGPARDQLMAIRNRLALIEANPNGLAITARNKLPQVNRRVKQAFAEYGQALAGVERNVRALPDTDLNPAGKQAVVDQLASLRGIFNPGLFEEVVTKMSDKGATREQRSGEREKGLRDVRRLQAYLKQDGRLQLLASTPFFEGMSSVLSAMMLALLDMENNMLVSV